MPVTTPVDEPIVATPVLALLHVPPEGEELNVELLPAHTVKAPVIAEGRLATVTDVTLRHPVDSV